jgi:hypothetical protein
MTCPQGRGPVLEMSTSQPNRPQCLCGSAIVATWENHDISTINTPYYHYY